MRFGHSSRQSAIARVCKGLRHHVVCRKALVAKAFGPRPGPRARPSAGDRTLTYQLHLVGKLLTGEVLESAGAAGIDSAIRRSAGRSIGDSECVRQHVTTATGLLTPARCSSSLGATEREGIGVSPAMAIPTMARWTHSSFSNPPCDVDGVSNRQPDGSQSLSDSSPSPVFKWTQPLHLPSASSPSWHLPPQSCRHAWRGPLFTSSTPFYPDAAGALLSSSLCMPSRRTWHNFESSFDTKWGSSESETRPARSTALAVDSNRFLDPSQLMSDNQVHGGMGLRRALASSRTARTMCPALQQIRWDRMGLSLAAGGSSSRMMSPVSPAVSVSGTSKALCSYSLATIGERRYSSHPCGLSEGLLREHCGSGGVCLASSSSSSSSSSFYTDAKGGIITENPSKRGQVLPKRDSLGPGLDPEMKPEELENSEGGGIGDIPMVWGRVHSIESFSAIDGPGIRSVIFLQGCWRRCLFCSNPDTWSPMTKETKRMSSKDIAKRLERNLAYYSGGGGVTLSGGEPLLQPNFCAAIFREAHAMGISTALDTAGYGRPEEWAKVLPHTDMVMLCLKAMDKGVYHKLVGLSSTVVTKFVEAIQRYKVPLVIRFVVLPGYTDTYEEIDGLIAFAKMQPSLVGVEILPYHTLGVNKWEELGLAYPLKGVSPPSKEFMMEVKARIESEGIKTLM